MCPGENSLPQELTAGAHGAPGASPQTGRTSREPAGGPGGLGTGPGHHAALEHGMECEETLSFMWFEQGRHVGGNECGETGGP